MESPDNRKNLLRLLVEHDPASPEFRSGVREALRPLESRGDAGSNFSDSNNDEFDLWRDVFVQQQMPWGRFLQSALLHLAALALIWTISLSWIRQQKILDHAAFDPSSLIAYTPEEEAKLVHLRRLEPKAAKASSQSAPAEAKQSVLSVAREANHQSQAIAAPDLKLGRDAALPNIVAAGAIVPAVPLEATRASKSRMIAPDVQVVAPPPDVQFAPDRVVRAAMKSEVIAPPPEVTRRQTRGLTGPDVAVVAPPPELTQLSSSKGHVGSMNIGPSQVVAPAPQLMLAEQHSVASRGRGNLVGGGVQPVGPAPTVATAGGGRARGRMIAGIPSVAPTGPVGVPGGNRRGLSASTQGKVGGRGITDLGASKSEAQGSSGRPGGAANGKGGDTGGEMASLSSSGSGDGAGGDKAGARAASPVADDNLTDVERQVFRGKRMYEMRLNMPNLNSTTGSWVMKFAELDGGRKVGELLTPVLTEKSDPGYPLELIRANVHGMVTLYAVIHSDGKVGDIRVLNSPDERLDPYAAQALARWKFLPAVRAGKPVALEAVVVIPFRVRRTF